MPTGNDQVQGVRFYLAPGTSFYFAVAPTQPLTTPVYFQVSNNGTSAMSWDEAVTDTNLIYIGGTTVGTVLYRWI